MKIVNVKTPVIDTKQMRAVRKIEIGRVSFLIKLRKLKTIQPYSKTNMNIRIATKTYPEEHPPCFLCVLTVSVVKK